MKQKVFYTAVLILLLTLCGCSAQEAPTLETEIVQTEAMTAPTEPAPTETEAKHNIELYELDTSEYDFTFEKVLLKIDWTDQTFALKCFDGSVVTGTVEKDSSKILLQHDNGRMILQPGIHNGKLTFENTGYNYTDTGDYELDQLMFCPQLGSYLRYHFIFAEDQTQDIIAAPEKDSLDIYKHVFVERYYFHDVIEEQGERIGCGMDIYHFPMQNKWSFVFESRQTDVGHTDNPDGTITFSYKGKSWNFHWDGINLTFDGGDILIADNGVDPKGAYSKNGCACGHNILSQ